MRHNNSATLSYTSLTTVLGIAHAILVSRRTRKAAQEGSVDE